jgi:hypothetical protein
MPARSSSRLLKKIQRKRSSSPKRRSPSPKRRSTSPKRRSTSPKRRSTRQRRRSTSPKKRSTRQRRRSTSQRRRSTSQRRRSTSQRRRSTSQQRRQSQRGGGSSDYANSWYSSQNDYPLNKLNSYTSANINNSPVFNPFSSTAKFATGTSGVIPTGMYYGVGGKASKSAKSKVKKPLNNWAKFIMKMRENPKYKNLKFRELLTNAEIKSDYRKLYPKKQ